MTDGKKSTEVYHDLRWKTPGSYRKLETRLRTHRKGKANATALKTDNVSRRKIYTLRRL